MTEWKNKIVDKLIEGATADGMETADIADLFDAYSTGYSGIDKYAADLRELDTYLKQAKELLKFSSPLSYQKDKLKYLEALVKSLLEKFNAFPKDYFLVCLDEIKWITLFSWYVRK